MERITKKNLHLSPKKRALFDKLIQAEGLESSVSPEILVRRERRPAQTIPLSFAQQRLWFFDQLEPGNVVYNCPAAVYLDGELEVFALEQALSEIVRRHEVLRTTFEAIDGNPVQVIKLPDISQLPIVDLKELEESADLVNELARRESYSTFNLETGPLFRVRLLRIEPQKHLLLVTMHHIISDWWSIGVFEKEIRVLYEAYREGREAGLAELTIQYADYAAWQREWLRGTVLEQQLQYWRKQLAGALSISILPDYPRLQTNSFQGARYDLNFSRSMTDDLRALSRQEGATLFMTMLAGFQALLYQYTHQDDITVVTPISNRNQAETEGLIGFFINMLALRSDLSGNPSFRMLLSRVREVTLGAYAHQDVPFEKLVEELHPDRTAAYMPLSQILFIFHNDPKSEIALSNVILTPMRIDFAAPGADFCLVVSEEPERLAISILYSTNLYEEVSMSRVLNYYERMLNAAIAHIDKPVSETEILTAAELRQVVEEWNQTETYYPTEKVIHQLIEEQANKTPDAIALVDSQEEMSYSELNRRANQLAHYLRWLGVGPESLVGICLERCPEMVVSILAVLKAGGAYVPLDPSYPRQRVMYMLEDSGAKVVLSKLVHRELLEAAGISQIYVDERWVDICRQSCDDPQSRSNSENIAYVIYTSGSTGLPKGAMNRHTSLVNRLLWMQQEYQVCEMDRVFHKTPFSFDVSVWELLLPLIVGGQMIIAEPGGHRDNLYLARLIQQEQVTIVHFVPSMLQVFLEEEEARKCISVRSIICSGEELTIKLQKELPGKMEVRLENLYGPTEAAIDVTSWGCRSEWRRARVPIGRPIWNTQIYILDERKEPVLIGAAGEAYIGGEGLARGYISKGDKTAESFLPNPYGRQAGARMYRTMDLGRYLPDGNLEYLGRIDHQVKLRGYRIELGEIENAVRQLSGIKDVAIVVNEEETGDKRLVGYYACENESQLEMSDLRGMLRQRLPEYMIPSAWMRLDRMPLTVNGKIDRKGLPPVEQTNWKTQGQYVAPRTYTEEIIAGIFCEVLGIGCVSIHDNFFEIGGHSLLATQVISRLRIAFRVDVPLKVIFAIAFTVAEMAKIIVRQQAEQVGVEELNELLSALNELSDDEARSLLANESIH